MLSKQCYIWITAAGVCAMGAFAWLALTHLSTPSAAKTEERTSAPAETTTANVEHFCGYCHKLPPPDSFARKDWRREVNQGFQLYRQSGLDLTPPPFETVLSYYEKQAAASLALRPREPDYGAPPVAFQRTTHAVPPDEPHPAISNVNLVHLFRKDKLDILACDMRNGWISALQPYEHPAQSRILGRVSHPAHAEVVDFEGNGVKDIVVADLGFFTPVDDKVGKVVLLKGARDGTFTPFTLLDNVGRVADVQAGDFNGDGKLDLIVAVFGWRTTGEIIYLENHTTDWAHPQFTPHVIDARHGAIHVPVTDLNNDGKLDFVALISQEHETIVAFLNDGHGNFRKETIFTASHPAYGSTGIQLVDLNNDGKIDVLYTNGDVMDSGGLRPDHGVQWLENKGTFPFERHGLVDMYGAHRAVAADIRGKGLKDIIAVNCLPDDLYGRAPENLNLDSIVYLEQTSPGSFTRHTLEKNNCNHVSCALGSLEGDGKIDLVTGDFYLTPRMAPSTRSIAIWKNQRLAE